MFVFVSVCSVSGVSVSGEIGLGETEGGDLGNLICLIIKVGF